MTSELYRIMPRREPLRPRWDTYFLGIAQAVAARADCTRRKIGAVIVDPDHRIISTGYNGTEPGGRSCLRGQCPRGQHYPYAMGPGECVCGEEWPCPVSGDHGSSYDTGGGACISTHAELNAIVWARGSVKGCTLYVTATPCDGCARVIKSAQIERVVDGTMST